MSQPLPGPRGLPLFGSSLSLRNGRTQDLVLQEWVKTYGPIYRIYINGKPVVILGNYEAIHEALVEHGEAFIGRVPNYGLQPERLDFKGIGTAEGPRWKEQRPFGLSVRDQTVKNSDFERHIKTQVDHLITSLSSGSKDGFDPLESIVHSTCSGIYGFLFGLNTRFENKDAMVKNFLAFYDSAYANAVGPLSPIILSKNISKAIGVLPQVKRMQAQGELFISAIEREIENAKKSFDPNSPPESYIHCFMKAQREGRGEFFTDDQLTAVVVDVFMAGTHTITLTLYWALLFFGHHPHVRDKIRGEIRDKIGSGHQAAYDDRTKLPYTEAAIMEIQRLANLVPMGVFRRTVAPVKVMGFEIPEDTAVVALLTNVLHNEEYFANPYEFRPERFLDASGNVIRDPKLIPFQLGRRMCFGETIARMELFQFISGLASRLNISFPGSQPHPPLKAVGGLANIPQKYQVCVDLA